GHPECNLCREKTIKVWRRPSRAEQLSAQPGRAVRVSRGNHPCDGTRAGPMATVQRVQHLAMLIISIPDRHPAEPAAFALATEPRVADRSADLWQPQRSMTGMGP